jgi:transposase InsO family protein
VFGVTAIATHPQNSVFQTAVFEVIFEFPLHIPTGSSNGSSQAGRLTSGFGRAWGCDSPALLDYLKTYDSIVAARASLRRYFACYNRERRHQSLDRQTPDDVYYQDAARLAT